MTQVDSSALAETVNRLKAGAATSSVESSLRQAVRSCVDLFAVDGGGVMMADAAGELRYAVAHNESSQVLEEGQSDTGEGPCVDAYATDAIVATNDLQRDARWNRLGRAIAQHEVRAVLSVPLHVAATPVGTFDVYATLDRRWGSDESDALSRYGQIIDTLLTSALVAESSSEVARQLQLALDRRIVVDRAVGFLMARSELAPSQAFDRLRREARERRVKVSGVAMELLAGDRSVLARMSTAG